MKALSLVNTHEMVVIFRTGPFPSASQRPYAMYLHHLSGTKSYMLSPCNLSCNLSYMIHLSARTTSYTWVLLRVLSTILSLE